MTVSALRERRVRGKVSLMRLSLFSFLLQWMLDRFRDERDSPRFEPDASLCNQ